MVYTQWSNLDTCQTMQWIGLPLKKGVHEAFDPRAQPIPSLQFHIFYNSGNSRQRCFKDHIISACPKAPNARAPYQHHQPLRASHQVKTLLPKVFLASFWHSCLDTKPTITFHPSMIPTHTCKWRTDALCFLHEQDRLGIKILYQPEEHFVFADFLSLVFYLTGPSTWGPRRLTVPGSSTDTQTHHCPLINPEHTELHKLFLLKKPNHQLPSKAMSQVLLF